MTNAILFFSVNFLVALTILAGLSVSQLIPTETRILFQVQRQLEYPEALQGWNNWTNFCYLPSSPSLAIVCSGNHVVELAIVGNKTSPSRVHNLGLSSGKFSASGQTLSRTFSVESFFTVLTKLSNLKSLSLVSLGLWGELPPKINRLRSLESLNLSSNFIYGKIPQSITTLKSIRSLVLSDNLFNGSVPDLKIIEVLEELDLSSNSLGPDFPSLGVNLVNVSLRNNSFKSEIPPGLGSLTRLLRFDVSYNNLSGPFPTSIFSLSSVQYINLAENRLNGTIPTNLSCDGNLTYVDFSHNLLVGKLPPCMKSNSTNRTVISSWNCLSNGDTKYQRPYSYCKKEELAVQPPTGSLAPKKETRIKLGLVIGVIGGTVVATAFLGLLIFCIIRRDEERRSSGDEKTTGRSFAKELSFRWVPKSSAESSKPFCMELPD